MVCNDLAEMGWGCKIEGRQKFGRGQVFAVEKVDISTALREGLSEKTLKRRKRAETLLAEMFEKYGVAEDEQRRLVKSLSGYAEGTMTTFMVWPYRPGPSWGICVVICWLWMRLRMWQ